jgi:hypothetical protein
MASSARRVSVMVVVNGEDFEVLARGVFGWAEGTNDPAVLRWIHSDVLKRSPLRLRTKPRIEGVS